MAHFVKLDETNHVIEKIVAEQEFIDTLDGTWIQTSYNTQEGIHLLGGTPLRWNYAGMGDYYNADMDEFHSAKPFDSWVFDSVNREWNPPLEKPEGNYYWDEVTYLEDTSDPKTQGWIEVS